MIILLQLSPVCIRSSDLIHKTQNSNKDVYTTASVACGWAGAVTQIRSPFISKRPKKDLDEVISDGPTDRRTDGPTTPLIEMREGI